MTVTQREGSENRKSQVKGGLQAKAAPSAGGGGSLCWFLNGAIDPVPMESAPSGGLRHSKRTGVRSISVPLL